MRSCVLTVTVLLGSSLVWNDALALRLRASQLRVTTIRTASLRPRVICPTPTAEQCRDVSWRDSLCGRAAIAAARVDRDAPCNRLLAQEAEAMVAGSPEREVIAPVVVGADGSQHTATALEGNDCSPGPGRSCAITPDYNHHGHFARGMHTLGFGRNLKMAAFSPTDNLTREAAQQRNHERLRRMVWNFNGNTVASCEEYVYEKYYDYSLFEDENALSGGDPAMVWQNAYGPVDDRSSIGTRDIQGMPLAQRDGTFFAGSMHFPVAQAKNVFFTTPMAVAPDHNNSVPLSCLEREYVAYHGVVLNDQELQAVLAAGAPTHDESFAWHREMRQALFLTDVLDEELEVLADFRDSYARLLFERLRAEADLDALMRAIENQALGNQWADNNPYPRPIDPLEWESFLSFVLPAQQARLDVLPAGGPRVTWSVVPPMDFSTVVPIDIEDEQAMHQGTLQLSNDLCIAAEISQAETLLEEILLRMAMIDHAIEDMLHRARARGCLDASDPHSPCDWSPRMFAQRVVDLFVSERERDFQKCMAYTANDFVRLGNRTFVASGGTVPGCDLVNYTTSPTAVETYFDCVDRWRKAVIAEIEATQGSILDPSTGKVRVGNSSADVSDLGSGLVGATLSYNVSWSVTGFEQPGQGEDPHGLDANVSGSVTADGSLFGATARLMRGSVRMTYESVDVDFYVGPIEIYGDAVEQQFSPEVLHPIADNRARNYEFISASMTVPVLGIPVTVRGAVSGSAGLEYNASAIRQAAAVNSQLVAQVRPFAGIIATASAGVDLLVIEAGIKGSITIVQLDLPFGAGTHIFIPDGELDPVLQVDTRGDLALSLLGGYLAVYGEIDLWLYSKSVELPIFSWPGIAWNANLYQSNYSVPLEPVFHVANHGIP